MKTILHIYWRDGNVNVRRLAGIHRFATANGMRSRTIGLFYTKLSVKNALKLVPADAIVLEEFVATNLDLKPSDFPGIPVVIADITPELEAQGFTGVRNSNAAIRKAVDLLLELGLNHYAYVGKDKSGKWTVEREAFARKVFTEAGKDYHHFDHYPTPRNFVKTFGEFKDWLSALPRPCGIFAANDMIGEWVLEAAAQLQIKVPEELAVMGVDNDVSICEYTHPTLASVSPAFEESGEIAARMVTEMLERPGFVPKSVDYGSDEVVRRRSIREFKLYDPMVQDAQDFIRREACSGITPNDVIRRTGLSARAAQLRFRRVTGQTIKNAISSIRIARACELLKNPNHTVADAVANCGYRNEHAFRLMFKRLTGLSPAGWRKRQ